MSWAEVAKKKGDDPAGAFEPIASTGGASANTTNTAGPSSLGGVGSADNDFEQLLRRAQEDQERDARLLREEEARNLRALHNNGNGNEANPAPQYTSTTSTSSSLGYQKKGTVGYADVIDTPLADEPVYGLSEAIAERESKTGKKVDTNGRKGTGAGKSDASEWQTSAGGKNWKKKPAGKEAKEKSKAEKAKKQKEKLKAKKEAKRAMEQARNASAGSTAPSAPFFSSREQRELTPIEDYDCAALDAAVQTTIADFPKDDDMRLRQLADHLTMTVGSSVIPDVTDETAQTYPLCHLPAAARASAAALVKGTTAQARASILSTIVPTFVGAVSSGSGAAAARFGKGERIALQMLTQLILRHTAGCVAICGPVISKELGTKHVMTFVWILAQAAFSDPGATLRVWALECLPLLARRKPPGAKEVNGMLKVADGILRSQTAMAAVRASGTAIVTPEQFGVVLSMCAKVSTDAYAKIKRKDDGSIDTSSVSLEMVAAIRVLGLFPAISGASVFLPGKGSAYLHMLLKYVSCENDLFKQQAAQFVAFVIANDRAAMKKFVTEFPAWLPETFEVMTRIARKFSTFSRPIQKLMQSKTFREPLGQMVNTVHQMVDNKYRAPPAVQSLMSQMKRPAKPDRDTLEDTLLVMEEAQDRTRPARRWPYVIFFMIIISIFVSTLDITTEDLATMFESIRTKFWEGHAVVSEHIAEAFNAAQKTIQDASNKAGSK